MSDFATCRPFAAALLGILNVPSDKSMSHRAVLMAAAAEGHSEINAVLDSRDVRSTISCVEALGAAVAVKPGACEGTLDLEIEGWGKHGPTSPEHALDCGNSGTTARLLMGLLAGYDVQAILTGDASLCKRPMARVTEPLSKMGARFSPEKKGTLPLEMRGSNKLIAIDYASPTPSAQVKTAILLAGLRAQGKTSVSEPAPSRDHTELMLPAFGVHTEKHPGYAEVAGPQALEPCLLIVPGDPSSAAFAVCAAALLKGSDVRVCNVSLNKTRTGFVSVLQRMGAKLSARVTHGLGQEPIGDIQVFGGAALKAADVKAEELPSLIDEVPVLALICTAAEGTSVFHGAGELRVKESDRLAAIVDGLQALGCTAYAKGDDLYVEGGRPSCDARIDPQGDHRLAMTWALAGWCFGVTVEVIGLDCCAVSYPRFVDDICGLQVL